MEWNGVSQVASFQFGPRSKWVPNGTLRAVSVKPRNDHCRALHYKGVQEFREHLPHILFPHTTSLDAIVMSIDMEGVHTHHDSIPCPSMFGVATLDTRVLFDLSISPSHKIHTKLFHRGRSTRSRIQNRRYLFSDRESYTKRTALDVLKKIFAQHKGRNVILLGHEIKHELEMMAYMKFKPEEHAYITHILDTGLLANASNTGFAPMKHGTPRVEKTLRHVLEELGFKGKWYHNAANDANFTLRGLLLLVARAATDATGGGETERLLREIAMTPFPARPSQLENLRPENAKANRLKKQAIRATIAEWDDDMSVFSGLQELSIDLNVA